MALNLVVDVFEPLEIAEEVSHSLSVTKTNLASIGLLDYYTTAYDNHSIAFERKEVHDFAHRVDDLEIQLRRVIEGKKADEIILIIEGIMEPVNGSVVLYRAKKDGSIFFRERVVNRPYSYYMGFLWRLDKLGISHFYTSSMKATALALVEFVKAANKPEFSTFSRYIKTRPAIPALDKRVQTLYNMGLGIEKAKALVTAFGDNTVWDILHKDRDELLSVKGVGEKTIDDFYGRLGKT